MTDLAYVEAVRELVLNCPTLNQEQGRKRDALLKSLQTIRGYLLNRDQSGQESLAREVEAWLSDPYAPRTIKSP